MEKLRDGDPHQIGKYKLLGRLGSGGTGDVFLGKSVGDRQVAVKTIRPDLAGDQNFRARFAREVEAASRVGGPFIVPVIEADPDTVLPWLVTGYVAGPSLADAVEQHGPLPLSAVFTLAAGLAEGLHAVHEAGVVHRDLKPSHVLLADDGPRMIDVGFSPAADFAPVPMTGAVIGTPGFRSPEQAAGGPAGPASDIFSLGAVLAFAAVGDGPYGADSPEVRRHHVLNSPPRLDGLPDELRPLIQRCLASDPADRPTASQFLADLTAARQAPAPATPTLSAPPAQLAPGWEQTVTAIPHLDEVAPPQPGSAAAPPPQPAAQPTPPTAEIPLPGAAQPTRQQSPPQGIMSGPPANPVRPPVTVADARPRKRRRRPWIIAAIALVAVAGTVIGLLIAAPWIPPVLQPTGLVTTATTYDALGIAWLGPPSGPQPDSYEVLQGGQQIATVPGTQTDYQETGLSPGATYHFSVIAVRGTTHSPVSSVLTVTTTNPPPVQPTGLIIGDQTPQSVEIAWSGPATGPVPDSYEILQDGTQVATVPGSTTDYQDAGLDPGTTYQLSVIAVRAGMDSPPSGVVTAKTTTPPLADAALNWSGNVNVTDTFGSFTQSVNENPIPRNPGDTWKESWSFTPNCASGPCGVVFNGSIMGGQFTLTLSRQGLNYSGSTTVNNWWECGGNSNDTENSTLHITVKGTRAGVAGGAWLFTSFTATVTWDVAADAQGVCPASSYDLRGQSA